MSSDSQYPHNLHPGLVPGIGIDEQRNRFEVDKIVFAFTAIVILAFIFWGVSNPSAVGEVSGVAFAWAMRNTSWLLNIIMILCLGLMLVVAFSRYGRIRLGRDDEDPEFSRFSWIAMMFAAGIGVGIFFFGPSEPLAYYLSPPPDTVPTQSHAAIHQAVAQANFHWGLMPWSLYAMVGGALAYSSYRRGRVALLSSIFQPLFGKHAEGIPGKIIDILSIVATLFGTAASLGISSLQISEGISTVTGHGPLSNTGLIAIIGVLTLAFIISAVTGVAKGVRYLSNANITFTMAFLVFVFLSGPTLFLLNLIPSGALTYLDQLLTMASKSLSWGEETLEFQSSWTAFYWAWWIAWTPFVGTFIAKISRGRTLREFILVTIIVPTTILIVAFTIFGGTAIDFARQGLPGFDGQSGTEQVLFSLFAHLPFSGLTPGLILIVLAIFFITSADSASIVMGTFSSQGDPAPKKTVVVFWGLCMMGIAIVMLFSGGQNSLTGLQNLTVLSAIPFSVVLLVMAAAFLKDLSTDPESIRRVYARKAVSNAVLRGLEEHGDDFELAVEHAEEGRGAGSDYDSAAPHVTAWYQRTDEDGNPVDYDYETGEWSDGYQGEKNEE
ncbi:BCCT family transporter [Corynebacterium poyangense]|uniref:BCCT family transporter n=1 Tax=Corynebacterium poyangense TaxID=2684405 RepID=A0A7H0SQ44_9CORY|nr:BCCT family transporter [Corynebacterium poyangense]MBZ8178395.1 BCCT family transporter [Corynebacterium poyangense]QNQ90669.1 BCCT family transporter [Corynebacterium poyangense]